MNGADGRICGLRERHTMAMELSEEQQRSSEGLICSLQLALERTSMRRSDAEQGMAIVLAGVVCVHEVAVALILL